MKKTKHVGAAICRLHIEEKAENNIGADALKSVNRKNKGITLIALIITIIVMLILVAVSIRIALSTGLFESAGKATKRYKTPRDYGPKALILQKVDPLTGKLTPTGEFIHGNNNKNSLGTYASKGCMRMDNEVIKEIAKQVKKGDYILIIKGQK